jgi:hypothetical protein
LIFPVNAFWKLYGLVDEIEVSENKEALIVLAGTVAGAATAFVASLPIRLRLRLRRQR